jgi:hypothetical protein
MPVPYDLTVQVDIWSSNTEQKLQILEQLLVLFNPSINLKLNDNPFDWTNLSYAELVNVVWSVRQVPQGTDDIIDVAALNFTMPIYINPPAKVKRQTIIHTILHDIKNLKDGDMLDWNPTDPITNKQWVVVTFQDLKLQVKIEGEQAIILNQAGGLTDDEVAAQITARAEAKKNKNFAESDKIRTDLLAQGIVLEDKPGGITEWRRA